MRKVLASALAAVTFGGAVAATAAPAHAEHYRNYGNYSRHRGGGDATAAAVIAGIAGLAIGAAISSKNGNDRYGRSYDRSYGYQDSYGYGSGYGYDPSSDSYYSGGRQSYGSYYGRQSICVTRERVWDPYEDRYVKVERRYAC